MQFKPGDLVRYKCDPDSTWVVERHDEGSDMVRARINGCSQYLAAGNLFKIEQSPKIKPQKITVQRSSTTKTPRKTSTSDDVAIILREAINFTSLMKIAKILNLNVKEIKPKVAHLNFGLQRMYIGNQLRKLYANNTNKLIEIWESQNT